jgi:hypothetical protein
VLPSSRSTAAARSMDWMEPGTPRPYRLPV